MIGRAAAVAGMLGLCMAGQAALVHAQAVGGRERPRVEIWFGASRAGSGPSGTLTSAYSPPLLLDGDFSSRAGGEVRVDAGAALAISGGVDVFVSRYFGFQLLVDHAAYDVTGANDPYAFTLQYVSRLPPDDRPQPVDITRSIAWPDTRGSVRQLTAAFNAIVRIGPPDRANVRVSGGPHLYRLSGTVQPVGYTAFQLGSRSVLFEDDYRLAVTLNPTYGVGVDIGADLSAPMASRAALLVGVRYFHAGDATASGAVSEILNPDQITFAQPLDAVAARIGSLPVRMSTSGTRLFVGVKVVP